jgi:hypothetical protein
MGVVSNLSAQPANARFDGSTAAVVQFVGFPNLLEQSLSRNGTPLVFEQVSENTVFQAGESDFALAKPDPARSAVYR